MKKQYKVILTDGDYGVKIVVYRKILFFWIPVIFFKPLRSCFFVVHDEIHRLKTFGDVVIDDRTAIQVMKQGRNFKYGEY